MAYLHEKGIVHRDLKPDNLVFDGRTPDAAIKLIDFGYAGHCSDKQPLRGLCGTPDYAAPEILTWYTTDKTKKPSGTPYGHAVDMWSLGATLAELYAGREMWHAASKGGLAVEVAQLLGRPPPNLYARGLYARELLPLVAHIPAEAHPHSDVRARLAQE